MYNFGARVLVVLGLQIGDVIEKPWLRSGSRLVMLQSGFMHDVRLVLEQ